MNRLGRGYSFEERRAKILFSRGAHKVVQKRPRFDSQNQSVGYIGKVMFDVGYGVPDKVEEINYGVDIDKLVAMIEAWKI